MQGYNVLHPMGFDAFGLPAENQRSVVGCHPYDWTMKEHQEHAAAMRSMGATYDWSRK